MKGLRPVSEAGQKKEGKKKTKEGSNGAGEECGKTKREKED